MTALALGSMCTGYAGLEQAVAAVLDVEPVWVADKDPGAAAILAHHMPDIPNLGDITAVDWTTVEPVDVLAAGFPCQDISYAGLGAGIRKGTRSGLWHTIAAAIGVVRPRLVVLENVAAIVGRRPGLDVVLADLAALGFDADWCCVRASDVGAPHRRERWFLLAWPTAHPDHFRGDRRAAEHGQDGRPIPTGDVAADTEGHEQREPAIAGPLRTEPRHGDPGAAADPARDGRHEGRPEPTRLVRGPDAPLCRDAAADADRDGRARRPQRHRDQTTGLDAQHRHNPDGRVLEWGTYGPAIDRWARILGRAAPHPTERGRNGQPRLSPGFVEWLMGLDEGHVTAVPGLTRNQQLHALGNGVVPQQGAAAIAHLLDRMGALFDLETT